jgi:hypothetical protein
MISSGSNFPNTVYKLEDCYNTRVRDGLALDVKITTSDGKTHGQVTYADPIVFEFHMSEFSYFTPDVLEAVNCKNPVVKTNQDYTTNGAHGDTVNEAHANPGVVLSTGGLAFTLECDGWLSLNGTDVGVGFNANAFYTQHGDFYPTHTYFSVNSAVMPENYTASPAPSPVSPSETPTFSPPPSVTPSPGCMCQNCLFGTVGYCIKYDGVCSNFTGNSFCTPGTEPCDCAPSPSPVPAIHVTYPDHTVAVPITHESFGILD